jgi:hypothetical protein
MNPLRWTTFEKWKRRFFGVARLTTYVFCVNLGLAVLGARAVSANLREGSLQLGRELAPVGDVLGATKTVFLNGAAMNVSNATTDLAPGAVLDRFEALCREHPALLARAFSDIPETLRNEILGARGGSRFGVMRAEAHGDGALTCFTDDRSLSLRDLPDRLSAFSESGDLSELGHFRYVYVRKLGSGKTAVRTVWTDGPLKLKEMFPASRDAAGFDSPAVPRPPESRRVFSATSAQVPFGVHIYDAPGDRESLARFYDERMDSLGWRRVAGGNRDEAIYMTDKGHAVYVTFGARRERTIVTTIETSRPDGPREVEVSAGE